MPELPEVETLCRSLKATILGSVLEKAVFYRQDLREKIPVRSFRKALEGQKITDIRRRSKYLLLCTQNHGAGLFHLGMSGQMLNRPEPEPVVKHTHLIMHFRDPGGHPVYIHFTDPRRFGRIHYSAPGKSAEHPYLVNLGPEPLELQNPGQYLKKTAGSSRRTIKSFLMDPEIITGIGNIYACEALHKCGIHPATPVCALDSSLWAPLASQIRRTLRAAIKSGGTTIKDFRQMDGTSGYFAISLSVYGRDGEPCTTCGQTVEVMKISGRNSWFCPSCQKP